MCLIISVVWKHVGLSKGSNLHNCKGNKFLQLTYVYKSLYCIVLYKALLYNGVQIFIFINLLGILHILDDNLKARTMTVTTVLLYLHHCSYRSTILHISLASPAKAITISTGRYMSKVFSLIFLSLFLCSLSSCVYSFIFTHLCW